MTTIWDHLQAEYEHQTSTGDRAVTDGRGDAGREATTTIGAESVEIAPAATTQTTDDTILAGQDLRGVPRGREAYEAREIAQTQPMQLVTNAIVDQLLGGELTFRSEDGDTDDREAELQTLLSDILTGPHLQGGDLDALLSAFVADMIAIGHGYAEVLEEEGTGLPVTALKPVDALTIRHNVDETGTPREPRYYQAPFRTASGAFVSVGDGDLVELDQDDLVEVPYPGSNRSDRIYPLSPAMQVKEWLELLADSTTHHSRYYRDNELPPGLLTAREANQSDVDNIEEQLQAAKGDPRSAPVVGTDARWVEVGGSAVDLSVVEEQQWFIQLVAAAFGVPKTELGLVEDVNRNTSESQLTTVFKRVTQPIAASIGQAFTNQVATQFDTYETLGRPFDIRLQFSDPTRERANEEFVRQRWSDGVATLGEVRREIGVADPDEDTTVTINEQTIDYAAHPKPVVEALLIDARNDGEPGEEQPETDV